MIFVSTNYIRWGTVPSPFASISSLLGSSSDVGLVYFSYVSYALLSQKSCSLGSKSDISSSDDQTDYSGFTSDDSSSDDFCPAKGMRIAVGARRKPLRKVSVLLTLVILYALCPSRDPLLPAPVEGLISFPVGRGSLLMLWY